MISILITVLGVKIVKVNNPLTDTIDINVLSKQRRATYEVD